MAHQQGAGGAAAHLSNPNQPAWKSMASTAEGQQKGEAWAKQAIWGNVPDDLKARYGSVDNMTSKQFTDMWKERGAQHGLTDAPTTAAAPADPKAGTVDVAAGAPAAPSAFDTRASAVPYHGVGGMFGPEYEASTTSATLSGPETQALNAIQPPAATAAPPVAAAVPAAPPPQPAAATVPPPPPAAPPAPPPQAAPPRRRRRRCRASTRPTACST